MKKLIAGTLLFTLVCGGILSFTLPKTEAEEIQSDDVQLYGDLDEGIKFFEGSWADALKLADKENKLIFLDAYASWCGPCKMMARDTFSDKRVGKYFNDNFISFKMDMEKHPDGPRLSKKFALTAYPSLYFLDKNEKVVHFAKGYQEPKDLIAVGQAALAK